MGFDQPRPMGHYAQGGRLAAPIFKDFALKAFKDMPVVPFRAPTGIRMVRIDRRSGRKVFGTWPNGNDPKAAVIWEAFKPESEPRRSIRRDQIADKDDLIARMRAKLQRAAATPRRAAAPAPRPESDALQSEDGIY